VRFFVVASRQPVVGRDAQKINKPAAQAGLATVVAGLIIGQTALPRQFLTELGRAAYTDYAAALNQILGKTATPDLTD
jgi:hypothetical protein